MPGGLQTDEDGDGVFERVWESGDYLLLPNNAEPVSAGNSQSRPYVIVEAAVRTTGIVFPRGRRSVRVTGEWGWWKHLRRATETADAISDSTTTAVTVSGRTDVQAGYTLLIDSEQMYVRGYSGDTLTVDRGINGTVPSSHGGGVAIDLFEYPGPIIEAAIIQTSRSWRRRDSAFAGPVGFPEAGQAKVSTGLDPDVALMLGQYRRLPV